MAPARTFKLGNRFVGPDHAPYVLAEMSGNHNQSLDRALEIVDAAAKAGAHGIKLQTYTADTMTLDLDHGDFVVRDGKSLWANRKLYDLYEEAHTPWAWHKPIFERARELGVACFSTPFDATSVDFLEELGVPAYKIASFENIDLPLLRKVGATRKPVILSTGMASVAELDEAVRALRESGCEDIVLLKCTSSYPSTPEHSNLRTIPHLRELFGTQVGLSDHTLGIGVAVASVALGATFVEKHFTLRRADGGVDSAFSLEPEELAALVVETERAWQGLGAITYGPSEQDRKSLAFRRTLYVVRDLAAGETLTEENVRAIRPGGGLLPKYLTVVLGRTVKAPVARGTPLSWDLLA